jgi:hypothetical protein
LAGAAHQDTAMSVMDFLEKHFGELMALFIIVTFIIAAAVSAN